MLTEKFKKLHFNVTDKNVTENKNEMLYHC